MQELDTYYEFAMINGHEITGNHVTIAEWSFNDIFATKVVNETDTDGSLWNYTNDFFPATSVANSLRPDSGIFYGLTNQAYTSPSDVVDTKRYYTAAKPPPESVPIAAGDDVTTASNASGFAPMYNYYQYWMSPVPSSIVDINNSPTGNAGEFDISNAELSVRYVSDNDNTQFINFNANKISITFNLGIKPVNWDIFVFYENASDWTNVFHSPSIDEATGKAELWWNGTAWVQQQQLAEDIFVSMSGVAIVINTVDTANDQIQVIELAAKREIDITSRVIDFEVDDEIDNEDFIHPVGTISANSGTLDLNNYDLQIDEQDKTSNFHGLLSGLCQYRIYIKYDLSNYAGHEYFWLQQIACVYGSDFQQQNEYEYQIQFFDIIKQLQNTTCPPLLIENQAFGMIVARILDNVGIGKYTFATSSLNASANIRYFWTDGTENVYDVLNDLCTSQQAVVFVMEDGTVSGMTRSAIANDEDVPVWTFYGQKNGSRLADIAYLQKKYSLESNDVLIQYKQMSNQTISNPDIILTSNIDPTDITQTPLTSQVYQTDDTVVLRASALSRDLLTLEEGDSSQYPDNRSVWIQPSDASTWPYTGKVMVDGEYISYNAKGYGYWTYSSGAWVYAEAPVASLEDQQKIDQATYNSFSQPNGNDMLTGGVSTDPSQQNGYTGRLCVQQRDLTGVGQTHHSVNIVDGWTPITGWMGQSYGYGGKLFEYGGPLTMANAQNWRTKPGWTSTQNKWSWANSLLTCDNQSDAANPNNRLNMIASYVRDLGSNDYMEFSTRFRLTQGDGVAGLILYMSNASGYSPSATYINDPSNANRCYMVNVISTPLVEASGRPNNEISVVVKNGNTVSSMNTSKTADATAGKWEIDIGVWYDLDVVCWQGVISPGGVIASVFEVYINGQYVDHFYTSDVIAPTGWCGLITRYSSKVDFEHFTATSASEQYTGSLAPPDEKFSMEIVQLPAGSNITKNINISTDMSWNGQGVISLVTTGGSATISSAVAQTPSGPVSFGPITVPPDSKPYIYLNEIGDNVYGIDITYSSSNELSVCLEYSLSSEQYNSVAATTVNNVTYGADGQQASGKVGQILAGTDYHQYTSFTNPLVPILIIPSHFKTFFDDFGAYAHEVRDFIVDLDLSPSEGTRIYSSNNNVKVIDSTYNPAKGIWSMVNMSHQNEIVNGTQQLDDNNSVDQTLMVYGYALVDNGDKTKEVKDSASIRKHGVVSQTLDANWVFDENDATDLGNWIIQHWSEPMDTIEIGVFANSFIQLGDKVSVNYTNADVDITWLFIVTKKVRKFDNNGFDVVLTLRRVR